MVTISLIDNRNIFDTQCKVIVNPINCVGVMGKGIALKMKELYPVMFEKYKDFCNKGYIDIGKLWLFKEPDSKWILNFPTKRHWKENSEYSYIEEGMLKFVETYRIKKINTIAFPLLGCGNGGLDKTKVLEIMTKHLIRCQDIIVEIYC